MICSGTSAFPVTTSRMHSAVAEGRERQDAQTHAAFREHSQEAAPLTCLWTAWRRTVNFVVVPIDRQPSFGFWLQADSAAEARKLVALNVPSMSSADIPDLAEC